MFQPTINKRVGRDGVRRILGLTVIELCVVMSTIAVLAMLLLPVCLRSRGEARRVICVGNLNGLGQMESLALSESGGSISDAYYNFEGLDGAYEVSLKEAGAAVPDAFMKKDPGCLLHCPVDSEPAEVLSGGERKEPALVRASYGYNLALPLSHKNASRVNEPARTAVFYDGDLRGVLGDWEYTERWAEDTIRRRHNGSANYLFLDGHVESLAEFPWYAFATGDWWVARAEASGSPAPPLFTLEDGVPVATGPCTTTITCLGAAFTNGANGHPIPVKASYRLNNSGWVTISNDVQGGEQVTLSDIGAGDTIGIRSHYRVSSQSQGTYVSDDGSGHVLALRNGDSIPDIDPLEGQEAVASFLQDYVNADNEVTIGDNDIIFLFELSRHTNSHKYKVADFQDLVVLISFSR